MKDVRERHDYSRKFERGEMTASEYLAMTKRVKVASGSDIASRDRATSCALLVSQDADVANEKVRTRMQTDAHETESWQDQFGAVGSAPFVSSIVGSLWWHRGQDGFCAVTAFKKLTGCADVNLVDYAMFKESNSHSMRTGQKFRSLFVLQSAASGRRGWGGGSKETMSLAQLWQLVKAGQAPRSLMVLMRHSKLSRLFLVHPNASGMSCRIVLALDCRRSAPSGLG